MKKWTLRGAYTILAVLIVAGLGYHLGLRSWCLHWGTTEAEAHATLPADDLFPVYTAEATHAITIHASPEKVWPWIMQIGQDRSGFYSYTFLENGFGCDMPKVEHVVPDWKPRAKGETVWFCNPKRFGGQGRMIAAIVDPEHAFSMVSLNDWESLQSGGRAHEGMWTFTLEPSSDGQTRLLARLRGGDPPTLASRLLGRLFWEPAHFVMEQKMLRTIRDLSERS
ncbi:MAG: hypothetical protein WA477_04620 [Candidatus Sulfotelmatobacter sp.]